MVDRPPRHRERVVDGGGERVLGCQPVVGAEHAETAAVSHRPAGIVMTLQIAEHPTAAVQSDEQPVRSDRLGAVEPYRDTVGIEVPGLGDRLR